MKIYFLIVALISIPLVLYGQKSDLKTRNMVVVTIDGLRWQEVFKGADSVLFNNKEVIDNPDRILAGYWSETDSERRSRLMPFFWKTIAEDGQIYGNRNKGSFVNVANNYWFSYPGYNEIFSGFGDPAINTNEYGPNTNESVFEYIQKKLPEFQGNIAVFASWNAFNNILNENRSKILVNAGLEQLQENLLKPELRILNEIQFELPDIFGGVRLDGITFQLGFNYLKNFRPRILYLAFDETDDFAHNGRYELYLNTAKYTDGFLQQLWQWIQSDPEYRNTTTLFITCDHGRGNGNPAWRDHGSETPGSDETWFAVLGPDTPALGEIKTGQYYNNQFASTIASLFGIDYVTGNKPGKTIMQVIGK